MKKNISINISGIIFHIEEDGYDKLKEYLESINKYFSAFDDSQEIVADIESRIAEIFLSKLKNGQQVIVLENVEELVATMGSIEDFQAAEEETSYGTDKKDNDDEESGKETSDHPFSKNLFRDSNKKLVAGVLSGISNYFNIDPLWIRLLYVLSFFGIWIFPPATGLLFLAYIVLWIIVPESDGLIEEKKTNKMFRNPDQKILGGVASGMSAYFGIDVVIVRLLFFITIFFAGTGIILYFILWIILPEAKTLTDKMDMQGQPVTLSNIEFNIKKSLNANEGDKNLLLKILLFPFRLIAALFEFISKALGPLLSFIVEALRVIFGVILTVVGISGVLSVLMLFGVIIGLFADDHFNNFYHIPIEIIKNDISLLPAAALGLALLIPFFYLSILGFIVLMKKQVLNSKASWSILAIWLISMVTLSFTLPRFIGNFKENGRFTNVDGLSLYDKTAVLKFNDIGEDEFDLVSMKIRSYADTIIKLEREYRASGITRRKAVENAKQIGYNIDVSDSILTFDSRIDFSKDAKFRKQHLDITLYLPVGQKFILDRDMKFLLGSFMYRAGFSNSDMDENLWQFQEDGLHCLTCPEEIINNKNDEVSWGISEFQRDYGIDEFDEIEINTAFRINIKQGKKYSIIIAGKKKNVDDVVIEKSGNILFINFKGNFSKHSDRQKEIKVFIIMPHITSAQFGSASKVHIEGFKQDFMDINLSGAAYANLDVEINSLNANINGASKLQIYGTGRKFIAKTSGASTLNAFEYEVNETEIETHSASSANVYAKDQLFIKTRGASTVTYKGNADVEIEKSGISTVKKGY